MKQVPFKRLRVSYIYCFRFARLAGDLLDKLMEMQSSGVIAEFNGFGRLEWDSGEGFQPYVRIRSATLRTSTQEALVRICEAPHTNPSELHGARVKMRRELSFGGDGLGTHCLRLTFDHESSAESEAAAVSGVGSPGLSLGGCLDALNMAEDTGCDPAGRRYHLVAEDDPIWRQAGPQPDARLNSWAAFDIDAFLRWLNNTPAVTNSGRALRWLCRDGDGIAVTRHLFETESSCCAGRCPKTEPLRYPAQNPYVYIELEAATTADYIELTRDAHLGCGQRCLRGVLAYMLTRVGRTGLADWGFDAHYLRSQGAEPTEWLFPNFYPVDYLFVNAHFRSVLVTFPPLGAAEVRSVAGAIDSMLKALYDTALLARARWYYLVSEHACVDALVRGLAQAWDSEIDVTEKFLTIHRALLTAYFTIGRMMENPVVHRRAASSLNDLYRHLASSFGIQEMLSDLLEKLRHTQSIHDQCMRIRIAERSLSITAGE